MQKDITSDSDDKEIAEENLDELKEGLNEKEEAKLIFEKINKNQIIQGKAV